MNHWCLRQKVKWHLISLMKVTKQHVLYINFCTSHYNGAGISAPLVATSSLFITWELNMVEPIAVTWMQIIILLTQEHPHTHICKHTARQKLTIRVLRYQCVRQADREKKRVRKRTNVSTWFECWSGVFSSVKIRGVLQSNTSKMSHNYTKTVLL